MKKAILYISFCLSCFPCLSQGDDNVFLDEASSKFVYEKEGESDKEAEKLSFTAGLQQINGFIESANRITQVSASLNYRLKKSLSFSISQYLNHSYFLNPRSKDIGLWIQDTVLSASQTLKWKYGSSFSFSAGASLPISYHSRLNNVMTAARFSASGSLDLGSLLKLPSGGWVKNLKFFISPAFRWYISAETSPSINQSSGGKPLPQFLAGIESIGLSAGFTDKLSLSLAFGRWAVFPYITQYKNKISPYKGKKYQRHYYLLSLSAQWQILKPWRASLSYSHTDRLDRYGNFSGMNVFDDQVSSWIISTSYTLSIL